ncbi:Hypothetical Protein FCC1311_028492 [Hondaea fermentalgiana]|uniref:Uncharacterized protein n=1 Tax=Hondaea fermentalgiana TaxID=2315210 RepID=A0A2R5GA74_9STRA|nr:Hypothetical Protein FCC1311_028492 [Hondaea fermentalgiana]|eukprot:GBG26628.1 Hypothetical Protein FCC1311_028492 [Hondaea fermentalgiana]
MHRLCRTPRVHLDVYSYGVSPETAQTVKYDPRMSRMRETYGPVLLKAPFSRWGGLKAAEARTSAASFARRDQRQPSHALVRPLGNLMPLDLKQENHRENLLGKIQ